jgi:NAD(P)-dependent dehydrogenase (short-subunit alcohol dehydrogenase family)
LKKEGSMAGEFSNKAAVVTGGSRGIGREIAVELARSGAQTVIVSSSADNLASAAKTITSAGLAPLTITADLRTLEGCQQAFDRSGTIGATALAASVTDPHQFHSGRQFAAWLGLTPLQKSSGGKERLGRITKMGDKYLRKLLNLLVRKPVRVATVAMANKTARRAS